MKEAMAVIIITNDEYGNVALSGSTCPNLGDMSKMTIDQVEAPAHKMGLDIIQHFMAKTADAAQTLAELGAAPIDLGHLADTSVIGVSSTGEGKVQ